MIKLFQKRTNVEVEECFDGVYWKKLCEEKRQLEERINMMSIKDFEVSDLLEDRLRVVDREINLIVTQEKEMRGEHIQGATPRYIIVNGRKTINPEYKEPLLRKAEDRKPLFVNEEMI